MSKEITANVGERHRFWLGRLAADAMMSWIDVEHTENGIRLRGGDSLMILPDVTNVVEVELVEREE